MKFSTYLVVQEDTDINMNGTNHFIEDSARHEGGAIYIQSGKINVSGKNVLG